MKDDWVAAPDSYTYDLLPLGRKLKFLLVTGAWKWINPELGDDLRTLTCTGALATVLTSVPLQLHNEKVSGICGVNSRTQERDKRTPGAERKHIGPCIRSFSKREGEDGQTSGWSVWNYDHLKGECVCGLLAWSSSAVSCLSTCELLEVIVRLADSCVADFFLVELNAHAAWEDSLKIPDEKRHSLRGYGPLFYLVHAAVLMQTPTTNSTHHHQSGEPCSTCMRLALTQASVVRLAIGLLGEGWSCELN